MPQRRPRIAVLGSINMDLVVRCHRLPLPGETVMAASSAEIPGGKGANQAVAAARLGAEVGMIGRVGNDAFAKTLTENLEREGINIDELRRCEDVASGLAVVGVEDSGENQILVVPGANAALSVDDVRASRELICNSDVLLLQCEVPVATVQAASELARDAGVPVVLDPAPAPQPFPLNLLAAALICPNCSEASVILGRAVSSLEDARMAVVQLHRPGVRHAVITLGSQGAVLCSGDHADWIEPFTIDPVDTTAAGDAFAAAAAVGLAEGMAPQVAVRWACAAGALAASHAGAQPGMPRREEVDRLAAK